MKSGIDFVLLWVDGNDPAWLEEKNKYAPLKVNYSSGTNRFRDWDNLQYWFRGVEQFAPWVDNIYFITWGHVPAWLDTRHPKLKVINHKDYIPEQYLPTFNSNTIELNLHRLPQLSEKFVLFNDDTFLLKNTTAEDFFVNGMPKDSFILNPVLPVGELGRIAYTNVNNTGIINMNFQKNAVIKKHFKKVFSLKYGSQLIRTLLLMAWKPFVGFSNPHLPMSHLKSRFDFMWERETEKLNATCMNKFRGLNDLNHWLMRYWNLCEGIFVPREISFGKYFNISDNLLPITQYITGQKGKVICINDFDPDIDFERAKQEINEALNGLLPEKSSFER